MRQFLSAAAECRILYAAFIIAGVFFFLSGCDLVKDNDTNLALDALPSKPQAETEHISVEVRYGNTTRAMYRGPINGDGALGPYSILVGDYNGEELVYTITETDKNNEEVRRYKFTYYPDKQELILDTTLTTETTMMTLGFEPGQNPVQLSAKFYPPTVNLIWESSDINVATVDITGKLTILGYGTVIITATIEGHSDHQVTITISIPLPVDSLRIPEDTVTLVLGNPNYVLTPSIFPGRKSFSVIWQTSNSSIVTVSNGELAPISEGQAVITATAADDNTKSDSVVVIVKNPDNTVSIQSIDIHETQLTYAPDNIPRSISYSIQPDNAIATLRWNSSDNAIVNVDHLGVITPLAIGQATVYATVASNEAIKDSVIIFVPSSSTSTGSVKGKLLDKSTSSPLINTSVSINTHTVTTDNDGVFLLSGLETGLQSLLISTAGFQPISKTSEVKNEDTTDLGDISLEKLDTEIEIPASLKIADGLPAFNNLVISVSGGSIPTSAPLKYNLIFDATSEAYLATLRVPTQNAAYTAELLALDSEGETVGLNAKDFSGQDEAFGWDVDKLFKPGPDIHSLGLPDTLGLGVSATTNPHVTLFKGTITEYAWKVGTDTDFSRIGETIDISSDTEGQLPVQLRVTDDQGNRTLSAVETIIVKEGAKTYHGLIFSVVGNGLLNNSETYIEQNVAEGENSDTVTAAADAWSTFTGWTGDTITSNKALFIPNVYEEKVYTANFLALSYKVGVEVNAHGSVNGNNSNFEVTLNKEKSSVTLVATADIGYAFVGWTGDNTSTTASITVEDITGDYNVTANFEPKQNEVEFIAGTGGVLNPDGESSKTFNIETGDASPTVTAAPINTWYEFSEWSGDTTTTNAALSNPNVLADKTYTANFSTVEHTLYVEVGAGGSVNSNSSDFNETLNHLNPSVELVATANVGYEFTGWSGDNSSGNTNITIEDITSNYSVKANFAKIQCQLNLSVNDPSRGTAIVTPPGPTFDHGTNLTITATPASSAYRFTGWSGASTSTNATLNITITDNITLQAIFGNAPTYTLGISLSPDNSAGEVTKSPNQTSYIEGTQVTLTATPLSGYNFVNWSGNPQLSGSGRTITVTMNNNISGTANFEPIITHTVTPSVSNESGCSGAITPSTAQQVEHDGDVQFKMTANSSCILTGLRINGVLIDPVTPYNFTNVTSNETIQAIFKKNIFEIPVSQDTWVSNETVEKRTENFGDATVVCIMPDSKGKILLKFDLNSLSGPVHRATLKVQVYGNSTFYTVFPFTLTMAQVMENWTESGVTWATSPNTKYPYFYEGEITRTEIPDPNDVELSFDITTMVNQWINGTANHGLEINGQGTGRVQMNIYSTEHATKKEPVLEIQRVP